MVGDISSAKRLIGLSGSVVCAKALGIDIENSITATNIATNSTLFTEKYSKWDLETIE